MLFNENDARLLQKTLEIREKIVDNLIKKELPTSHKDVDSITNLLESIDRSILGKTKLKIEETNSKNIEETKEAMIEILLNLHKTNSTSRTENKEKNVEIPENLDSMFTYRKEEFDTTVDTLTINDFNEKN